MADNQFYADGQWNFYCDLCGKKNKSANGVKTWDNFYVCKSHNEQRNPQDYLRGIKDDQSLPWSRPRSADTFVPINWTREIAEELTLTESISKGLQIVIGFTASAGINDSVLNGEVLNGAVASANPEQITFSEVVQALPGRALVDSFGFTETISFILSDPLALNGSAINSHTLG